MIFLPAVYEPTYMYIQYMALLFMSLSIAQLDIILPFRVLEVMTSKSCRGLYNLSVPSRLYTSVNLVACPSWLSLAKLHGIQAVTPLMP